MKGTLQKILFVVAAGLILLVVLETGVYNWRLLLSMRYKTLTEMRRQLRWRRDELLVERAVLLSPKMLEQAGEELGLSPVSLEDFTVVELSPDPAGGDLHVCMER